MKNLQEIFDCVKVAKKKQKETKDVYRDFLSNDKEYQDVIDNLKTLKAKKQQYEEKYKQQCGAEFSELEKLKTEIENYNQMLSDIAFNQLMKGETVEVTDQYSNQYEPIFSIKFKKVQ